MVKLRIMGLVAFFLFINMVNADVYLNAFGLYSIKSYADFGYKSPGDGGYYEANLGTQSPGFSIGATWGYFDLNYYSLSSTVFRAKNIYQAAIGRQSHLTVGLILQQPMFAKIYSYVGFGMAYISEKINCGGDSSACNSYYARMYEPYVKTGVSYRSTDKIFLSTGLMYSGFPDYGGYEYNSNNVHGAFLAEFGVRYLL